MNWYPGVNWSTTTTVLSLNQVFVRLAAMGSQLLADTTRLQCYYCILHHLPQTISLHNYVIGLSKKHSFFEDCQLEKIQWGVGGYFTKIPLTLL